MRRGSSLVKTPSFLDELAQRGAWSDAAPANRTPRRDAPATGEADFEDEVRRLRKLASLPRPISDATPPRPTTETRVRREARGDAER